MADGTTSLYFSTGGGFIGGGQQQKVRDANRSFLRAIDAGLGSFSRAASVPLPTKGLVGLIALTYDGRLRAGARESDLIAGSDALSRIFHAAMDVITAYREATSASGSS